MDQELHQRIDKLAQEKNWDEIIRLLTNAFQSGKIQYWEEPIACLIRGVAYLEKKDYVNALRDFIQTSRQEQLISKNPFLYTAFRINKIISDKDETTKDNLFKCYAKLLSIIQDLREKLFYGGGSYEVAHYTSLDVLKLLADDKARFRLYNASYMNDPEEGRVFFEIMKDETVLEKNAIDIKEVFYSNNLDKLRLSPAYIGSFVKVDSESKEKEDGKLFLWRTYGKHGNDEAAGTCLIFNDREFAEEPPLIKFGHMDQIGRPFGRGIVSALKDSVYNPPDDRTHQPDLYMVKYEGEVKDDTDLRKLLAHLADSLNEIKTFCESVENVNTKEKLTELVRESLDSIRFLFKTEDYKEEREVRVVRMYYYEADRGSLAQKDLKIDTEQIPPRFYLETPDGFEFNRVILGPGAGNLRRWEWWLQREDEELEVRKSEIKFGEEFQ